MKLTKKEKYVILVWIIFFCLLFTMGSCSLKKPVQKTDFCLNTVCTIEVDNMDREKASDITERAFEKAEEYERMFSRTIKGSDIYRINHSRGKKVTVSCETAEVIKEALKVAEETGGVFDPTMGKLAVLWNFTGENPKVPSESSIKKALSTVDYRKVKVKGNTVQLENPETEIDTGGIAKGYIAYRLAYFLKEEGVKSGLVNLGGDITVIGKSDKKIRKEPWKIGIETPYSRREKITGTVEAENETVLTSGIYERCFTEKGKLYHHILDPATGYPADTDLLSFTIRSSVENGPYCDAYATAAIILGSRKGPEFINKKEGYEYALIDKDNNVSQSKGFNMVTIKPEK